MERTTDEIADELLVLSSQSGDAHAWRTLVVRWHPKLFAHARRLAGSTEGAADITQDAWLAIVRSIRRLDDPARFRYWAHRIVANKAADWIRRRQRQRRLLEGVAEEVAKPTDDRAEEDDVLRQERVAMVRKAIRHLPAEHRRLIALFYNKQKSIKEIAQRLSIPQGTVKSRLHSIRQELKSYLEETSS